MAIEPDITSPPNAEPGQAGHVRQMASLLADILGDASLAQRIDADTDIVRGLGLDSIQMIRFLLSVEDDFDVEVDFEELDLATLSSLGEFCAFVLPDVSP